MFRTGTPSFEQWQWNMFVAMWRHIGFHIISNNPNTKCTHDLWDWPMLRCPGCGRTS